MRGVEPIPASLGEGGDTLTFHQFIAGLTYRDK